MWGRAWRVRHKPVCLSDRFRRWYPSGLSTLQSWVYRRRRQASTTAEPPVRLLPVQVSSAPVPEATALELVLVGGMRVLVSSGTDVDYVARLVAALGRSAC